LRCLRGADAGCRICTQLARELNLEPVMTFEPTVVTRRTGTGFSVQPYLLWSRSPVVVLIRVQHQVVIKAIAHEGDQKREFTWPTNKFEDLLHYLQELSLREQQARRSVCECTREGLCGVAGRLPGRH
jgi:hypothetical protein